MLERGIHSLLSGQASGRVYAMRAPQNATAPFIVFQRTDGAIFETLQGPSELRSARVRIDCYAEKYYTAKDLGEAVRVILDGYRGTITSGTSPVTWSVRIGGVTLQSEIDILDETDNPVLHRYSGEYNITYEL